MAFWNDPSNIVLKQQHRWVVSFGQNGPTVGRQAVKNERPLGSVIPQWFAKSVDKPSFTNKAVQFKYLYSHTFNFPTRVVWNPIKITLYDIIMKYDDRGVLTFLRDPYTVEGSEPLDYSPEPNPSNFSTQLFFSIFLQRSGYYNPEELSAENQLVRFRKYNFKKDMINALLNKEGSEKNSDYEIDGKTPTDTRDWSYFAIKELAPDGRVAETWKLYNPLITDVSYDKLDYSAEGPVTVTATIAYDWAELDPTTEDLFESAQGLPVPKVPEPEAASTVVAPAPLPEPDLPDFLIPLLDENTAPPVNQLPRAEDAFDVYARQNNLTRDQVIAMFNQARKDSEKLPKPEFFEGNGSGVQLPQPSFNLTGPVKVRGSTVDLPASRINPSDARFSGIPADALQFIITNERLERNSNISESTIQGNIEKKIAFLRK